MNNRKCSLVTFGVAAILFSLPTIFLIGIRPSELRISYSSIQSFRDKWYVGGEGTLVQDPSVQCTFSSQPTDYNGAVYQMHTNYAVNSIIGDYYGFYKYDCQSSVVFLMFLPVVVTGIFLLWSINFVMQEFCCCEQTAEDATRDGKIELL